MEERSLRLLQQLRGVHHHLLRPVCDGWPERREGGGRWVRPMRHRVHAGLYRHLLHGQNQGKDKRAKGNRGQFRDGLCDVLDLSTLLPRSSGSGTGGRASRWFHGPRITADSCSQRDFWRRQTFPATDCQENVVVTMLFSASRILCVYLTSHNENRVMYNA